VHKSRKYDFLFGDDEQKDNFLNPNRRAKAEAEAEGVAVPEGRWAEGSQVECSFCSPVKMESSHPTNQPTNHPPNSPNDSWLVLALSRWLGNYKMNFVLSRPEGRLGRHWKCHQHG